MEGASQTPEAERCQSLSLPSTDKMTRPPSVWLQLGHVVMAYLLSRVGECWSRAEAEQTYHKHGTSDRCKDSKGGPWANDVYFVGG